MPQDVLLRHDLSSDGPVLPRLVLEVVGVVVVHLVDDLSADKVRDETAVRLGEIFRPWLGHVVLDLAPVFGDQDDLWQPVRRRVFALARAVTLVATLLLIALGCVLRRLSFPREYDHNLVGIDRLRHRVIVKAQLTPKPARLLVSRQLTDAFLPTLAKADVRSATRPKIVTR